MSRQLWLPNTEGETHREVILRVGDEKPEGRKVSLMPGNEPEAGVPVELHKVPGDVMPDDETE